MGASPTNVKDSKDVKKSSKSRKKSRKAAVIVEVSEDTAGTSTTPKESTLSTNILEKTGVDGVDTETVFENKKALKRAIRAARVRRPADENAASKKESGNKRKDRAEDAASDEPPKKKHKNRTEFADPRVDTTLNPQSSKALEYAFTQMNRPSKWKFNKARQNWLIRNIWAPEALPDVYVPLVVKYLTNVQGGSRQKLIESCQSYLKVEEKQDSAQENTAPSTISQAEKETTTLKSILKPTPGPLIPGPLIDTPSAPSAGPEGSGIPASGAIVPASEAPLSAIALADIRRTRAQTLLDALGGPKEIP
ncbi:hypothetical protein JR316_0004690 [Psilocybe cubensis]|uniref:WKF domain-containing protein n=2 Tax=Psilocybe cubensis TaxID=181762 RepID=A0A8H7Y0V4_PSICU|nr:hypothetical protein JR316_0004690 [Psilocybe cubensis]KAH9482590.1 hypothetical protein JR316_0004690 [Psilocybe cubensis]